jgi:hypothetical protein
MWLKQFRVAALVCGIGLVAVVRDGNAAISVEPGCQNMPCAVTGAPAFRGGNPDVPDTEASRLILVEGYRGATYVYGEITLFANNEAKGYVSLSKSRQEFVSGRKTGEDEIVAFDRFGVEYQLLIVK